MSNSNRRIIFCTVILLLNLTIRGLPARRTLRLRSVFQSGTMEREASTSKFRYSCNSFFQITPFFGSSLNPEDLARYFFPYNKYILLIAEQEEQEIIVQKLLQRDIKASALNIATVEGNFASQIFVRVYNKLYGAGISYRQRLFDNFWIEASIPALEVRNKIELEEKINQDGGGKKSGTGLDDSPFSASATEAFGQKNWRYGKICSNTPIKKSGFGDLDIKIGFLNTSVENVFWNGYLGISFPTSNRPRARTMFEPMLGNHGHYGLLYGSNIGVNVFSNAEDCLLFGINLNTQYLFAKKELRSFDLEGKEFSAYIDSYKDAKEAEVAKIDENENSGTSGINIYTQKIEVSPGASFSVITHLTFTHKNFEIEGGYSLYIRQREKIFLNWEKTPAIRDKSGKGYTNACSDITKDIEKCKIKDTETCKKCRIEDTGKCKIGPVCIGEEGEGNCNYATVSINEINEESASTPYTFTYGAYLALGYTPRNCPIVFSLGTSYEASVDHDHIRAIKFWGKIERAF